jgi:glycosyltransferase involved in cell wall biosynthesis
MKKENRTLNIIYLGMAEWEGMHLCHHHMAEEFAKMGHKVIYVSPPSDLARCINIFLRYKNLKPLKEFCKKLFIFSRAKKLRDNFFIVKGIPLLLGLGFSKAIDDLNQGCIWWYLRRLAKKFNLNDYVLYTTTYFPTKIKDPSCKLFVFDCVDELSCMTSLKKRKHGIGNLEKEMLQNVDVFFAISKSLFSDKSQINPQGFYAPPSIDWKSFIFHKENQILKRSIQALGSPIIGLVAAMSQQKIDWEAISFAAKNRPRYKFVLAGPVDGTIPETLRNLENVFFIGPQNFEDVPPLVECFDVCLIPFNQNTFGRHAFPTKMPEYLSLGKPVVSTDIPNLREYEGIIEIAKDKEEFAKKIDECLAQNHDEESREKRKQIAKHFSKEERAKGILEKMNKISDLKFLEKVKSRETGDIIADSRP